MTESLKPEAHVPKNSDVIQGLVRHAMQTPSPGSTQVLKSLAAVDPDRATTKLYLQMFGWPRLPEKELGGRPAIRRAFVNRGDILNLSV
ncbi:hypothetical protein IPL68_03535 [Candidatus Saccharibacteria bacterium]|nr:MAG: hypothetical protein IPL68_03535 [Candidatus Saccharibacteria bacterium]